MVRKHRNIPNIDYFYHGVTIKKNKSLSEFLLLNSHAGE